MSPAQLLIAALSTLLTVSSALAQMPPARQPAPNSKPYRLTRPELTELATQVCMTRHNVSEDRISAWQERPQANPAMANPAIANQGMGGPGMGGERANNAPPRGGTPATPPMDDNPKLRAVVDCKPHRELMQYSLSYSAQCERRDRWICGRSELRLRTVINDHPVTIHSNGYNADLAHDLVRRIFAYRTHKGGPAIHPETAMCALTKGPEKDMLDVVCDGHVVRLSYWCPQSSCPRVFSIDGFFIPANAAGL